MSTVRFAELLLGLCGVADLGMGQPVGAATRTCHVAVGLARALDVDEPTVSDVFHAALLQHVGCTAYSHEASLLFGDEISIKRASLATDFDRPQEILLGYLPRIVREAPRGDKLKTARGALLRSRDLVEGYTEANCEVAAGVARRLALPIGVQQGLLDAFEAWNGSGQPHGARGADISIVARIVTVAGCVALFHRLGGPDAAARAVRQRAGRLFDPAVADAFARHAVDVLGELIPFASPERLLDLEPEPRRVDESDLVNVLRTFGEAVDLKAPFLHGHSTNVARLAGGAAVSLRLGAADAGDAELAGYVHDLGRAAVPSAIWEYAGPLGADAWSQVRLHPYHSEQILIRSRPLARLARIAGMHHERLDGSGYHRGARSPQLPMTARVLAAADAYQAMTSDRPYRPAYPPARAAAELTVMSRAGALDPDAARAVLAAAAGRPAARTRPAGGLTERQIDVLRLVAEGLTNRAVAERLGISRRTAEHHVQDVYTRIGVASRAAAAMYAMEHGLLGQPG